MGLILLAVLGAAIAAWLMGGRLSAVDHLPVRGKRLLLVALVPQFYGALLIAVGFPVRPTTAVTVFLSSTFVLLFCLRNRALHGIDLVALGLMLNTLVITLNGAMPVSANAAVRAGIDVSEFDSDSRHQLAGETTILEPLGDVLPMPLPGYPEVDSIGDLVIAAGLAQLVATAMLRRRTPATASVPAKIPLATLPLASPTPAVLAKGLTIESSKDDVDSQLLRVMTRQRQQPR